MKKVFLAVDKPGWSLDNIAKQLVKRLSNKFEFTIGYYCIGENGKPPSLFDPIWQEKYDVIVALNYPSIGFLAQILKSGVGVSCVYDHYSLQKHPEHLKMALGFTDILVVSNEKLVEDVMATAKVEVPMFVCEDGVDGDLFYPLDMPSTFTVGWTGNSDIGTGYDAKGVQLIMGACVRALVPFSSQDIQTQVAIPHDKMIEWYRKISCYVCASESEGTPNPVLEAMACCRHVISTDVGIAKKHGAYIVERDMEAIKKAILDVRDFKQPEVKKDIWWHQKILAWEQVLDEASRL